MANPTTISVQSPTAGIIKAIRLENFMCHSSLQIELGDRVNFITGQNGSGKSAILTALCVAFGCRAKGTQRASTLKDFIKTGCGSALVLVELKNEGEDAFKQQIYGDVISIERRISGSTSSIVLKDHRGKKVASRKEELRELVEHFNIDVENPCVIMSQDKSREFLHSGNDKDKFKFFFKATLLQHVSDLLENIDLNLKSGNDIVRELEDSVKPIEKELSELREKIDYMKHVERITQELQDLKKKLAWSWVYTVDRDIKKQTTDIEKRNGRIPVVQAKIDGTLGVIEELTQQSVEKKAQIARMLESTSEMSRKKGELQHELSLATKKKLELGEERNQIHKTIQTLKRHVKVLEKQVQEIHEQHVRSTQAEESHIEEKLKELQDELDAANLDFERLQEEENSLSEKRNQMMAEIKSIDEEIEKCEKEHREFSTNLRHIQQHQTNKVTAFGGEKVINLLRQIERSHRKFKEAPIGPIGAHVTLGSSDKWAPAVEQAVGKLLNAFIVTDHKDCLLLRACAREANYSHVQIIIYDFSKPRLHIPNHMLPQTHHPTTMSVLHSENETVLNVLIDQGSVERQVLVEDYTVGKVVAFDSRDSNLKEVYTLDGYKMFSRASVQTVLPPNKTSRAPRLCSSFDEQIKKNERGIAMVQEKAGGFRRRKRDALEQLRSIDDSMSSVKRRCYQSERNWLSKKLALQEFSKSYVAEASASPASSVNELHQEISKTEDEIQQKEALLDNFQVKFSEAEDNADKLKLSFENFCKSAKGDIEAFGKAEEGLMQIEENLRSAEEEKKYYEGIMSKEVLEIKNAEAQYQKLKEKRVEDCRKASIICPESEVEAIGGCNGSTPEKLSPQLTALEKRLKREKPSFSESIDELSALYEENESKILGKRQRNKAFRGKLDAVQNSLDLRRNKLQRNADCLKRQITWEFNNNLRNKGITGHINVSYEEKTLSVQVKMPQDASNSTVRDIRGLSGGERSFSTLCFALALHNMTEAPFRAMDEFDVFMDAVSRKISLDTLVDFALAQGSQWVFITPNDISMVRQDERIRKQQMAAPRS